MKKRRHGWLIINGRNGFGEMFEKKTRKIEKFQDVGIYKEGFSAFVRLILESSSANVDSLHLAHANLIGNLR